MIFRAGAAAVNVLSLAYTIFSSAARNMTAEKFRAPRPQTPAGLAGRTARAAVGAVALYGIVLSGCAALTNPVANGVPVHVLPDELLAESREGFETIPLTMLRQKPPEGYLLAAGDTLGIFIEGILGAAETPPPVNIPDSVELPLSIGYPIPVRADGTISLPYIKPIDVDGMSVEQAEEAVYNAYKERQILRPETEDPLRIFVTLMRPRYIRVLVIRDDTQERQVTLRSQSLLGLGTTRTQIGGGRQGEGMVLELPAYQNDVLNAITRSGGLPGLESTQEIIVQRGYWDGKSDPMNGGYCYPSEADQVQGDSEDRRGIIRIPMRVRRGQSISIPPEDIILENGDIVVVKNREPEFYYTGGLLPADEVPLPNDYDLTVVEAVLKGNGPLLNGGVNTSNLSGAITGSGVGNPSPSLLAVIRQTPNGGQVAIRVDLNQAVRDPRENILVQAGDILILQETPDEAITRYISQTVQLNLFTRFLNRTDAQGSVSVVVP
jgi:protein involved in polysaccharide export with SLBB domain